MRLRVKRLTSTAILPAHQSAGAAGLDLHADCPNGDRLVFPGEQLDIGTGIAVAIPPGYEGQVRGRSGFAFKRGVQYYVGTIDSDYRGEIRVLLRHDTKQADALQIKHGDRIAQLVIAPCARCEVAEVTELDETERGEAGFGSTGANLGSD